MQFFVPKVETIKMKLLGKGRLTQEVVNLFLKDFLLMLISSYSILNLISIILNILDKNILKNINLDLQKEIKEDIII